MSRFLYKVLRIKELSEGVSLFDFRHRVLPGVLYAFRETSDKNAI